MIHHVVLFRFRPGTRAELEPRLAAMLDGLPGAIDVIRGWRHGPNLTVDADAWDYALAASFDSETDLFAYFDHPAHIAGLEPLAGEVELKFVDFAGDAGD